MNRFSGSRVPRISQCIGSVVLPEVRQAVDEHFASRGKELHAFFQNVMLHGEEVALERMANDELRAFARRIDLSRLPASAPESFMPEVSLAYDPLTDSARFTSEAEPCGPLEIGCQLDALGETEGSVVVWDYKTGARWLGDPNESQQLRTYALAAARALGKERASIGFIRIDEHGEPRFIRGELEAADLDEQARHLEELFLRALAEDERAQAQPWMVSVTEGPECERCPAFERCPAKLSTLRAVGAVDAAAAFSSGELDAPTAVLVYQRLAAYREVLDVAERRLRDFVKTTGRPLELGDGRVWGPKPVVKKSIDPAKAEPVLAEHYGQALVDAVRKVEVSITNGDLEEALGAWWRSQNAGKSKGVGKVVDAAFAQLREAGALVERESFEFRTYKPKQEQLQPSNPNPKEE